MGGMHNAGNRDARDVRDVIAFQAAGWLEPDPYPVRATALVSGVVDTVLVTEGEVVSQGQELARLDQAEFLLALQHAEADVTSAQATVQQARQQLAVLTAQRQQLEARVQAQRSRVAELADFAQRRQAAPEVYSDGVTRQAVYRHQNAQHVLAAEEHALAVWQQQYLAAEVTVQAAEATLHQMQLHVQHAQLDLQRTVIRAPIDGMILKLHAVPGRKQMLRSDNSFSTTVAELFDSKHLQVRVDVPLADAGGLAVGQQARITSDLLPHVELRGTVTRLEGHADVTRNTLQAKVRVLQPDQRLRPEMLMRVQFFPIAQKNSDHGNDGLNNEQGGEHGGAQHGEQDTEQSFLPAGVRHILPGLPQRFLQEHRVHPPAAFATHPASVKWDGWLVDADNRLQPVQLRLGGLQDGMVVVADGAPLGSWLVADAAFSARAGQLVRPVDITGRLVAGEVR
jgi:multidrug resistance efflux pump